MSLVSRGKITPLAIAIVIVVALTVQVWAQNGQNEVEIECEKRINEAKNMLDVNIRWDKDKNKCISLDVFTWTEYELVKENGNWAWVHLLDDSELKVECERRIAIEEEELWVVDGNGNRIAMIATDMPSTSWNEDTQTCRSSGGMNPVDYYLVNENNEWIWIPNWRADAFCTGYYALDESLREKYYPEGCTPMELRDYRP